MQHPKDDKRVNIGAETKRAAEGKRELDIDGHIQTRLQASFADVLKEPIPERFLKLLDKLGRETRE